MAFIEVVLAIIGLGLLILLAIGAISENAPEPPEDPATPYRQGLHAAIRMQAVAQDLEQQIYAEAAKHMKGESGTAPAQASERL
jgi:hypothetical protein